MKKIEIGLLVCPILCQLLDLQFMFSVSDYVILAYLPITLYYAILSFKTLTTSYSQVSRLGKLAIVLSRLIFGVAIFNVALKLSISFPTFNSYINILLLTICIITFIIKTFKHGSPLYKESLIRAIILFVLTLSLILIPKNVWRNYKFRNYPAFVKKYDNHLKDVTIPDLRDELDAEWDKIYRE